MTQLQALIFDVDGTLANTEEDGHRVAFNQAFTDAGLDWYWSSELYSQLLEVGGGRERIVHYIQQYQNANQSEAELQNWAEDLHQRKNQYYQDRLKAGLIELRLGVKRLITEARKQKLRLAIATTSALPNVMTLLEKKLNPDWFEVIAAGDMVAQKKPAPDIYYYALEKLNLSPEHCLVFEDSNQGLQASSAVGLKTIVTVNHYTQNQDFSAATLVLNHLGEPETPFKVLAGNQIAGDYLTVDILRSLL